MPVGKRECGPSGEAASRETLDVIADKWSMIVVHELRNGPLRFAELDRKIEGLSRRMLTVTLRNQERFGLIKRTVESNARGLSVTYSLTPFGRDLAHASAPLITWIISNLGRLDAAKARFAESSAAQ